MKLQLAGTEICILYHWIIKHVFEKHPGNNPLVGFEQTTNGIGDTTIVECKTCHEKKNITDTRIW